MKNFDSNSHQQCIPLQTVEEHWKQIYDMFDVNGDNQIPLSKLSTDLQSSNPYNIPSHAIFRILKEFDTDKDGFLSFSDFIHLMENEKGRKLIRGWTNTYIHHAIPRKSNNALINYRGEYEDQYSCCPPPVAMIVISLIEIVFFICHKYVGSIITLCLYDPNRRDEAWRFITYMFVHDELFHLFVNLTIQVFLAIPLEMVHGWYRILFIYFSGVIVGSLATSVFDPTVCLGGASAGVYAILTAHLANIIMNWSEMEFPVFQLIVFLLLAVVDISNAIYERYFSATRPKIGYVAHLAGALAGLLLGLRVLRNLKVYSWEKIMDRVAFIIYFTLIAAAILWNILVSESYYKGNLCYNNNKL